MVTVKAGGTDESPGYFKENGMTPEEENDIRIEMELRRIGERRRGNDEYEGYFREEDDMTESEIRSKLSPALTGARILPDKDYIKAEAASLSKRGRKVLECPFCGDIPSGKPTPHNFGFALYCHTCEYHGPWGITPGMALESWNVRGGI
jgi:hypothetical protein